MIVVESQDIATKMPENRDNSSKSFKQRKSFGKTLTYFEFTLWQYVQVCMKMWVGDKLQKQFMSNLLLSYELNNLLHNIPCLRTTVFLVTAVCVQGTLN